MSSRNVKKASIEIVDGLKCILDAQFGKRSKQSCVPIIKVPVSRFCKIARKTVKRVKKKYPRSTISDFLGYSSENKTKMGIICSRKTRFPQCELIEKMEPSNVIQAWKKTIKEHHPEFFLKKEYEEVYKKAREHYVKQHKKCDVDVENAIKNQSIEQSQDYSKLLTSFETMRDWMHTTGYSLPDYVWKVPKSMRERIYILFEFLASKEVQSTADLDRKRREIQSW